MAANNAISPTTKAGTAAYLEAAGTSFVVREAPMPAPAPHEIVIRNRAVAINPTDQMRQSTGAFIDPASYPYIIGCDSAGTIAAVGNDIEHLTVGDRVMVLSDEFQTHLSSHGSFQQYVLNGYSGVQNGVCKIPNGLAFEDAAVLPLALSTAAGMLFEKKSLNLDRPTIDVAERARRGHEGEIAIVWGGSSSVGCCAIQMLRLAGYRVIATASHHNASLLRVCGAEEVFNHTLENCVDQICTWVEGKKLKLAGVAAIVIDGPSHQKCGQIAKRLSGNKFVATSLPRGLMPEPDLGEDIKTSSCLVIEQADLMKYIWKDWMPEALELGQLKCLPKPEVVGQGLESIDAACDVVRKGVSGKKVVVSGI